MSRSISYGQSSTAVTSPAASALNAQSVLDQDKQRLERSQLLQRSTHLFRRVPWASDDRARLFATIGELRKCIEELEGLLEYRSPQDPEQILGANNTSPIRNVARIQQALHKLHAALIGVNGPSNTDEVKISVRLAQDYEEAVQDLVAQEENLSFRDNSYAFFLQIHKSSDPDSQAVQVIAETTQISLAPPQDDGSCGTGALGRLSNLKDAIASKPTGSEKDDYDELGCISRSRSSWDIHNLFYHTQHPWYSSLTLEDVLITEEFRDRFNPIQRTQLATLVSTCHLYFALVRSTCLNPRPSCFRFYRRENQSDEWDEYEPYVLNPYLCIGFGSRPPKRNVGASSGITRPKSSPILELGLVLHQIGSSTRLDYGVGQEGLRRAKMEALQNLHNVDLGFGGRFTEVVQMCLDWRGTTFASAGEEEFQLIEKVVAWLTKFERSLE